VTLHAEKRILAIIRQAEEKLPPRHRKLVHLDLVEGLSAEEIQERMQIHSHLYFKKLKHEAFAALKRAVKAELANGVGSFV
jgi:DNA-directed RNA polymerase specialized sigma24 family protein